jgi:opacity protein-like surface antigen
MLLRMLLTAGAALLPAIAVAQPVSGLYVSGNVSVNIAGSLRSDGGTTSVDTNPGPLGVIGLGWGFGNGLRVELEGSYRSNAISGISTRRVDGDLLPLTNAGGSLATAAAMANVAYDLPFGGFGLGLQPYVGAGLGYGRVQFNDAGGNGLGRFALPENNTYIGPDVVSFGGAGAFAYQAIVGASLPIHIVPGLDATIEYRFFGTSRADVPVTRVSIGDDLVNGELPGNSTHNGFEVHDNALMIGVRYQFGAP